MEKVAVIVAGGTGSRMGADIPKQFLLLNGKPILLHTLLRFKNCCDQIILVLPEHQINYWHNLMKELNVVPFWDLTIGGATRFNSVKNGLSLIKNITNKVVAIHDGVRPFIDEAKILNGFAHAMKYGNAIFAVDLKDSVRQVDGMGANKAVERKNYKLIQTPQLFQGKMLSNAYQQKESPLFTDDASVIESLGEKINLIEGDYKNIKITTPEDLLIAKAYLV